MITFTYTQIISIIKSETWVDRLSISALKYPGFLLLVNSGDGDIFVSSLELYWGWGANMTIKIGASVKKGEIQQHILEYTTNQPNPSRQWTTDEIENTFGWFANSTGIPSERLVEEADLQAHGKCGVMGSFLTADYSEIGRMNRHYMISRQKLETMPIESYVNWSSAHTGKTNHTPLNNIVMAFRYDPKAGCTQADLDELQK